MTEEQNAGVRSQDQTLELYTSVQLDKALTLVRDQLSATDYEDVLRAVSAVILEVELTKRDACIETRHLRMELTNAQHLLRAAELRESGLCKELDNYITEVVETTRRHDAMAQRLVQSERDEAILAAELKQVNDELLALKETDVKHHLIEVRPDGWTIQHPLSCRPDLFNCRVNRAASATLTVAPNRAPGIYRCEVAARTERLVISARPYVKE